MIFLEIVELRHNSHNLEDLQKRFDKVKRVRMFQLHRNITTISHVTDTVSTYFTKLKEHWVESNVILPFPNCGCPRYKEYLEHLQQHSGLNDAYAQSKQQILKNMTKSS